MGRILPVRHESYGGRARVTKTRLEGTSSMKFTHSLGAAGVYTIGLTDDGSGTNGTGTFSFGGTLTFDGSEVEGVYTTTISSNVDYQ